MVTDKAIRLAEIHKQARKEANRSREYMSLELGVNPKTVQNWEEAKSCPNLFQSLEWFRALNVNPFPYYLAIIFPDKLSDITPDKTDKEVNEAFNTLIQNIDIKDKRALLYLYYGKHGSSPHSVIQLMLCHLHLPLSDRLINAVSVLNKYKLHNKKGSIICKDNIKPDLEDLSEAINQAEESHLLNEYGYNNVKEDS